MNDELLQRARDLLALRDKATPGPWKTGIPMNIPAFTFAARAHDMADTIRDLVAEVERLERLEDANADALKVFNRRLKAAEAAEARLRELASAEPVAWHVRSGPEAPWYYSSTAEKPNGRLWTEFQPLYALPAAPKVPS